MLGVMFNALACLAVWLCFSARTTTDKILAIIFPITAFVAARFEHCVANMCFISIGTLVGKTALESFLIVNLLPVFIGTIIGGTFLVGLVYWFMYIRSPRVSPFT